MPHIYLQSQQGIIDDPLAGRDLIVEMADLLRQARKPRAAKSAGAPAKG